MTGQCFGIPGLVLAAHAICERSLSVIIESLGERQHLRADEKVVLRAGATRARRYRPGRHVRARPWPSRPGLHQVVCSSRSGGIVTVTVLSVDPCASIG